MIDTQAIRKKILDLALRGKLTEQLPEDGTAEGLYQQVLEAKVSFELTSNERKSKPLPDITAEELPFIIPISWKWVHLGELFAHNTGKALNTSDTTGRLLEYITTSNVYWDRFELTFLKTMYFKEDEIDKCTIKKGDLLVCEGGDIGRSAIWAFDTEMRIQNHIHRLRRYNDSICTKFYYYVMQYYKINNLIRGQGIGLEGFSSKRLHSLVVPYPPVAEQTRIVGIVDSAFEILKQIDILQSQYQDNLVTLKSKIIDAGIQGKLTEQLPEDGNAEELYQQIQQEKLALEKAGKIKKSKPLPPISEEEKPFDISENWKWVQLNELSKIINGDRGKNYPAKSTLKKQGIPFISAQNLDGKTVINDDSLLCMSDEQYQRLGSGKLQVDDIVICIRGSLGKHGRYPFEKGAIASSLVICRPYLSVKALNDYIMLWLDSALFFDEIGKYNNGSAQPNLAANNLEKFYIPLPPLAEQKRIVAKLEELLPLCEG